ncbi:DUF1778 domain-containing protein [Pseudoalteromonas fuliginea]|uniref:type II toxin -antitoxin system TacA 1-like antitoxin n=1 Tax=Pseudoalteromonas fuliginea TaxID=1872678 RepID=UPI00317567B3
MMTKQKTEYLNIRISPDIKALIKTSAESERRSISNFIECLVVEYSEKKQLNNIESRSEKK